MVVQLLDLRRGPKMPKHMFELEVYDSNGPTFRNANLRCLRMVTISDSGSKCVLDVPFMANSTEEWRRFLERSIGSTALTVLGARLGERDARSAEREVRGADRRMPEWQA